MQNADTIENIEQLLNSAAYDELIELVLFPGIFKER